jgi:hypothetical protein
MKTLATLLFSALLVTAQAAFADANANANANAPLKPPRLYTGVFTPGIKKANSFAPRSSGTKSHVYGAPIQSPILKRQPKAKSATAQVPKHP